MSQRDTTPQRPERHRYEDAVDEYVGTVVGGTFAVGTILWIVICGVAGKLMKGS